MFPIKLGSLQFEKGFQETPERLLYVYNAKHPVGVKFTVLPNGHVEMGPEVIPKNEINDGTSHGLITYTFPQTITPKAYVALCNTYPDHAGMVAFPREDKTNALVQSWGVNVNKSFFETFAKLEEIEPQMQQAKAEFEQSLKRLFVRLPEDSEVVAIRAREPNVNKDGLLRGTGASILVAMKDDGFLFEDMVVGSDDNGFVTRVIKKDGTETTKRFSLSPDVVYALYKNSGWDTLLVPTPWDQFGVGRTTLDGEPFAPSPESNLRL